MAEQPVVTLRRKWRGGANRLAPGWQANDPALPLQAFVNSLKNFAPATQVRNRVMFVVWLGALITAALTVYPPLFGPTGATRGCAVFRWQRLRRW